MRSVDTNVIVRWLLRDDLRQAEIADQIMDQPIEITLTVMLELAWVLMSIGRMVPRSICRCNAKNSYHSHGLCA